MSDARTAAETGERGPVFAEQTEALQDTVRDWFARNGRSFPWRKTSEMFHILIAEVLLRRTQAERVVGPYLELIGLYPNVQRMAEADVAYLREWFRPLGLVSRANQLVDSAGAILELHSGTVPRELGQLMRLPGLGRYSARAIVCLGYGDAVPMIDESSGRLLRRLLGLRSTKPAYSDEALIQQAVRLVPLCESRAFNLGILDIAALYCHSGSPNCAQCPLRSLCSHGRAATGCCGYS